MDNNSNQLCSWLISDRPRKLSSFITMGLALVAVTVLNVLSPSVFAAGTPQFYVSPTGDGRGGGSLTHAWTDPSRIDWSRIPKGVGACINIAPGTYSTPWQIPVGSWSVVIRPVYSPKGGAVIFQANTSSQNQVGLDVLGTGVLISGWTANQPVIFKGFKEGVKFECINPDFFHADELMYVEVTGCSQCGVEMGNNDALAYCNIHDNKLANLAMYGKNSGSSMSLSACWIHNDSASGPSSDGIYAYQDNSNRMIAPATWSMQNCVIGPGLNNGINCMGGCVLQCKNSLFLDGYTSNLTFSDNNDVYHRGFPQLMNSTFVSLPQNSNGKAHFNLNVPFKTPSILILASSIIYGGSVAIPAGQQGVGKSSQNIACQITGNIAFVASKLSDPKFKNSLASVPNNASPSALASLDFTPMAKGAARTGSGVTSVAALLKIIGGLP